MDYDKLSLGELIREYNNLADNSDDEILAAIDRGWPRQSQRVTDPRGQMIGPGACANDWPRQGDRPCDQPCDHGSKCKMVAGHQPPDRHMTEHGCIFYDAKAERIRPKPCTGSVYLDGPLFDDCVLPAGHDGEHESSAPLSAGSAAKLDAGIADAKEGRVTSLTCRYCAERQPALDVRAIADALGMAWGEYSGFKSNDQWVASVQKILEQYCLIGGQHERLEPCVHLSRLYDGTCAECGIVVPWPDEVPMLTIPDDEKLFKALSDSIYHDFQHEDDSSRSRADAQAQKLIHTLRSLSGKP